MGGEGELAAGLEKQNLGFDSRPGFSSFTKVGKERENEKFDKCKTPVNFMFFYKYKLACIKFTTIPV